MDYQGNAKKDKEAAKKLPEKKIEKVVVGEVVVQKKSLGRKFKDIFIEADFKSVVRYVISDVLIPAARNMVVDASTEGIKRMMYGEVASRRRQLGAGPRVTYNSPVNRAYREAPMSRAPGGRVLGPSRQRAQEDFVLSSREEAEQVLERLNDIIDTYEVASVADLNELVGFPSSHVDNKWGWSFLGDVQVRQIREGYLIELPPAEAI